MVTNTGPPIIPDSDDQYYYSDIDDVHAPKDPSVY